MKDLFKILKRPYKRKYLIFSILAILFMILDVGIALIIPRITENIFTEIVVADNLDYVVRTGVLVIAIAILAVITTVLNNIAAQYISTKVTADIRKELFEKIQDLSFSNVDSITSGRLITIVTNDTTQIQQIVMMSFRAFLRSPLTLIGALIMAYSTNKNLFVIIAVAVPILGFSIWQILKNATKIFSNIQLKLDDLNTKLLETVSGAREIKSFVTEIDEVDKFDKVNDNYTNANIKVHRLMSFLDPVIILVSNAAIAAVLYYSAYLATGYIDQEKAELIGNISAYISYLQQIIMSLMMLSMIAMQISRGEVSARRINLVLGMKINIINKIDPMIKDIDGVIEFNNVSFGYKDEDDDADGLTLQNINFKIPAKSSVGIIGSTGSGKTSLVQLLPRLYDVSGGEVLIDGINVKDYDLEHLRNQISYVTQEAIIFSGTIASNILQGKEDAKIDELNEASSKAVASEFIEKLDDKYNSKVNQRGTNLSGGQRQRLALARALIRKPKILILDDSTSAVDAKSEALIKENVINNKNQTTLIVAQKISSIKNCDYIIVLDNNGRLDGFASHDELIKTSKVYQEIYISQTGGYNE